MKSYLSVLAISALLLTGCSSTAPESKPEYDEVELMVYQACLNKYMKENDYTFLMTEIVTQNAVEECKAFKPVKK
jgi:uncharacterized protein YcfL